MAEVTLDAGTIAQLRDAQGCLAVRDSTGQVVGYFLPAEQAMPQVIFGVKSPYSREEIERRFRECAHDARPLTEFWSEMRLKYPDQFQ